MGLNAWSYSRLTVFESCRHQAELKFVRKIPEPDRPLPPGKTEHANDRGTRVHEAAEKYVLGGIELIPELESFKPELNALRTLYAAGKVSLEGEWGYTKEWKPTPWMSADVWTRIKLDAIVFLSKTKAVVIDYKTGKRWGNEIKHGEQMQLYQLAAFLRYPDLQEITVELWYTDLNELVSLTYTRAQGMKFLASFTNRGKRMTECEDFPPNPNAFSCRFCPYKPVEKGGTGHCSVGV